MRKKRRWKIVFSLTVAHSRSIGDLTDFLNSNSRLGWRSLAASVTSCLFWGFSGLRDFFDHMFHSHHKSRRGAMWCTRPQPAYISQFILPGFSELSQSKHLEMLQMMLFTACECLRINQAMFHHWLLIFDPLSHSHSANGNFWMTKTSKLPWQMSSEPNTGSFLLFSTSEHREVKNAEKESIWLTSEQAKFSSELFVFSSRLFVSVLPSSRSFQRRRKNLKTG